MALEGGTLFALIASWKMHAPEFLGDISWLTFGRVRPVHLNVMIYGFASETAIGVTLWLMCRLCRTRRRTTFSDHNLPVHPNLLKEAQITGLNQVWVADITYIETKQGWLYLAGVLDLYSRKIVGWAMSERIDTNLVLSALDSC